MPAGQHIVPNCLPVRGNQVKVLRRESSVIQLRQDAIGECFRKVDMQRCDVIDSALGRVAASQNAMAQFSRIGKSRATDEIRAQAVGLPMNVTQGYIYAIRGSAGHQACDNHGEVAARRRSVTSLLILTGIRRSA